MLTEMRRILCAAHIALAGIALATSAWADMTLFGTNPPPPKFGGPYTGPGEVVTGAQYWYSCFRGYTQFYASGGRAGCNVRRNDNAQTCDILIAPNGTWGNTANCSSFPDNGKAPSAFCTGTTCFVTTMYDQTDNGYIVSNATAANQPQLLFSGCGGALAGPGACVDCSTAGTTGSPGLFSNGRGINNGFTSASPITISGVYLAVNATGGGVWATGGGIAQALAKFTATPALDINAGADATLAASFATWYAVHNVINPNDGSTSTVRANGTTSGSQNAGNGIHFGGGNSIQICGDQSSNKAFVGKMTEIGSWSGALSGTQQGNLESNQRAFWGF
jgi:hypothetical protein